MPAPKPSSPHLNPAEKWWAALAAHDDRSAVSLLQTEALIGNNPRSVYELFSEMTEKDGHLHAVLQTRLNGLLGLRRRVVPGGGGSAKAARAAELVRVVLQDVPRLDEMLRALLDGISKGFAAVELVWDYDTAGRLVPVDWIAHPQEWFAFTMEGALRLLAPPFQNAGHPADDEHLPPSAGRHSVAASSSFAAPDRKFIVLRFGADARNPYGRGLCQRAYWLYWLKKNALKQWALFNERYGAPTALARYGPGTAPEERRELRDMLAALQTDSCLVIPESVELSLLEAGRGATSGETFRHFLDWCNDEISKVVVGATLTSGEGRRSGSLALGSVHQLVRQDYIEADARLLEQVLADSLLRWICELNLGQGFPAPHLAIETAMPQDPQQRLAVDQELLRLGVRLPESYFHNEYARPAPGPQEPALRYDDANFYAYHLQYGVLTVNEVRQRLGLRPVPWGGERTHVVNDKTSGVADSPEDRGDRPQ